MVQLDWVLAGAPAFLGLVCKYNHEKPQQKNTNHTCEHSQRSWRTSFESTSKQHMQLGRCIHRVAHEVFSSNIDSSWKTTTLRVVSDHENDLDNHNHVWWFEKLNAYISCKYVHPAGCFLAKAWNLRDTGVWISLVYKTSTLGILLS